MERMALGQTTVHRNVEEGARLAGERLKDDEVLFVDHPPKSLLSLPESLDQSQLVLDTRGRFEPQGIPVRVASHFEL
jgi:hypothetical protein